MDEKIHINLDKGFSIQGILIELLKESLENLKKMQTLEARNVELADQIDYIKEKYSHVK